MFYSHIKELETEADIDDAISSTKASMIANLDKVFAFSSASMLDSAELLGMDRRKLETSFVFAFNMVPSFYEALDSKTKADIVKYINDLDFFISAVFPPERSRAIYGDDFAIMSFETPFWMFDMLSRGVKNELTQFNFASKCALMNIIPDDVSEEFYKQEFHEMQKTYGDKFYENSSSYPTLAKIDCLMAFTPNTFAVKSDVLKRYIKHHQQQYLKSSDMIQYTVFHRFINRKNNGACNDPDLEIKTKATSPEEFYLGGYILDSKNEGGLIPKKVLDELGRYHCDYAGNVTVCVPENYEEFFDIKSFSTMSVLIPQKEIKYTVDKNVKSRFFISPVVQEAFENYRIITNFNNGLVAYIMDFWNKNDLAERMLVSDVLKKFITTASGKQAAWENTKNVIGTFRVDPRSNGKMLITQAYDVNMQQIDLNKVFMSDPDSYLGFMKDVFGSLDIKDYYTLSFDDGIGVVFVSKKAVGSLKIVQAVEDEEALDYLGKDDAKIGLATLHGKVLWYSDETFDKLLTSKNLATLEEMFSTTIGKENYEAAVTLIALGEKDPFKKLKLKK